MQKQGGKKPSQEFLFFYQKKVIAKISMVASTINNKPPYGCFNGNYVLLSVGFERAAKKKENDIIIVTVLLRSIFRKISPNN